MKYTPFGTSPSRLVIQKLEEAGHEAVFVGGAVRDYILGKDASDIDIATSATPEQVKDVFSNTIDVGIAHGTVLVLMNHEPIEVTTYRTESTYSDHRRPDEVMFVKSLREDLQRRDFTMNALALTLSGDLIDPFGGRIDLNDQLIRAVGNPDERFNEDALRMLRAVRFSSVLGFEIEKHTVMAISRNADKIRHVSIERIKVELDKLWKGMNAEKALLTIMDTGLSNHLPLFSEDDKVLSACAPFDHPDEGWAIMMIVGQYTALEVTKAYKLSNREKTYLLAVEKAFEIRLKGIYTLDTYYLFPLEALITIEKVFRKLYPSKQIIEVDEMVASKNGLPILSKDDLKVDGKDLMAWKNQRGGRWVGEWMDKIEQAVLHRHCPNDSEYIKEWFLNEYKCEE